MSDAEYSGDLLARRSPGRPRKAVAGNGALAAAFPRYRIMPLADLVPYASNARTHSPAQVDKIAASLLEFGFTNPVLTDGKRGIIAGHGRVLAAEQIGMQQVPTIELRHLTPAQKRAYILADNRLAEDAGWDRDLLAIELGELRADGFDLALTGFELGEIDKLIGAEDAQDGEAGEPGEAAIPEPEAPPAEPVTRPGDVWRMGAHRLICGDVRAALATLADDSVQCVVTSPPYYGLRDYGVAGQIGLEASPDEFLTTMVAVFREVRRVLRPDGVCFVNMGDSYAAGGNGGQNRESSATFHSHAVRDGDMTGHRKQAPDGFKPKDLMMMPARLALALQADGWWLRSAIVWHKPNPMPESVTDRPTNSYEMVYMLTKSEAYFWDAEAVKEPASENTHPGYSSKGAKTAANAEQPGVKPSAFDGYRPDTRNIRNVWTIQTAPFADAHFATFPPALPERCIRAASRPADLILDPFAGAFTTGVVAEQLGRECQAIELSPAYCDVAVRRWQAQTGQAAWLETDSRSFAMVATDRAALRAR